MKKIASGMVLVFFVLAGTAFGALDNIAFTTADGTVLPEGCGGYVLYTDGGAAPNYLIDFSGTTSDVAIDEPLGLYLVDVKVQDPASLQQYYITRGVPEPYLSYLINAADVGDVINPDPQMPFAYIHAPDTGGGPYPVSLYDGAHYFMGTTSPMIIPGDYPCGTYTVAAAELGISFTLTILGAHCGDADNDCYPDDEDLCPGTGADEPDVRLGVNRWIYNDEGAWEKGLIKGNGKGPDFEPDIWYTYGCSCEQILDAMAEATGSNFNGHYKFGCSKSILEDWNSGVYILDDGTEVSLW